MELNLNQKGLFFSFTGLITNIENGSPEVFTYKVITSDGGDVRVGLIGSLIPSDETPAEMIADLRQNNAQFSYEKKHRGHKDLLILKTAHCRFEQTLE